MDEAELAAGRVQVGEASILWHIEVDIEVDIEASEGLDVAAWSLLEASRPPVDLSLCHNIDASPTWTRPAANSASSICWMDHLRQK